MKSNIHGSKLDNIGMTASILCAIHCAVVPIIITSLPLIGFGFLANPWVEWGMILFALCIGFYAIGLSYFKTHHKIFPFILMIGGFLIIIAGHLFVKNWHEAIVVPMGGLLIATAHFFNYRYTGACTSTPPHLHFNHKHSV